MSYARSCDVGRRCLSSWRISKLPAQQRPQVSAKRPPSHALIWCDLSSLGTGVLATGDCRLLLCSSKDKGSRPDYSSAVSYPSGQKSRCLRDQFEPLFRQKKSSREQKTRPRSGLASDFRDLAVGWQSRGVAMGVFCLSVKSSEL